MALSFNIEGDGSTNRILPLVIIVAFLIPIGLLSGCQTTRPASSSSMVTPTPLDESTIGVTPGPKGVETVQAQLPEEPPSPVLTVVPPWPTPTTVTAVAGNYACPLPTIVDWSKSWRPTNGPTPKVLAIRNFDSWCYMASSTRDSGGEYVRSGAISHFDHRTVESLRKYAEANKAMASELAAVGGQGEVVITFRTYVQIDEFRAWAKAKGIYAKQTSMREGGRATTIIMGMKDDPLPDKFLRSFIEPESIAGVFSTEGTVDAKRLPEIASDPLVFLADVTSSYIKYDLARAGVPDSDKIEASTHSPFWSMEDLGLKNFMK